MPDEPSFFSGLDLLDGLPARRAGTILYAIEGRTAQLVSQSRQALASYLTEKSAEEKEQAFLAALSQGRDLPLQPSIQELERFAPEWATLVPAEANLRAALAHSLGEKYRFRLKDVPAMRRSLGLEAEAVEQAFERMYQHPLDSVYSRTTSVAEQIRWLLSRLANGLERMPPFWTAFSLTLTETVGGSVLALPIALAGVGPIPGVVLLVILGLVNILTIAGIVEAITRNGNMRYGTAYFGRLVGDYLGRPGSIVLAPALLLLNVLLLTAFYVGISTSLGDATGTNPMLWAALVFLVAVYFLRRESLSATVASALVIGIINILIIIVISVLAFFHLDPANLRHVNLPFGEGRTFDPRILELVFGVVLTAYFGHTSAGNAAKVVLRRDPGGRSLVWGNIAAMATAIALYSLWVVAVNGALPAAILEGATGTVISPLAARIGGVVPVLGAIYVILAMGMGSVHFSYGLYYQAREVLPSNLKRNARLIISIAPVFLLFVVAEWLLFTRRESFSGLLGILGVLLVPILGGVFPMLMLAASRRKGDYAPRFSLAFLGHPVVVAAIYLLYLGGVFIYGLIIWQDPLQRAIAIGVGVVMVIVTGLIIRRGAFAPRMVVELRVQLSDTDERATFAVIADGKPVETGIRLEYADGEQTLRGAEFEISSFKKLKRLSVQVPAGPSRELKLWAHVISPEGYSRPLPAALRLKRDGKAAEVRLDPRDGQALLPFGIQKLELEITLHS